MIRVWAFVTATAALAVNLFAQSLLMARAPSTLVPGLADFRPAWNHGVSFSLFIQNSDAGRYVLMALTAAISIGAAVMAWRAAHRLFAVAYGLILGGGLGNLIDRIRFGAVFDFLSLHLGGLPLFVCNLPDIAISGGFVLWLAGALLDPRPRYS